MSFWLFYFILLRRSHQTSNTQRHTHMNTDTHTHTHTHTHTKRKGERGKVAAHRHTASHGPVPVRPPWWRHAPPPTKELRLELFGLHFPVVRVSRIFPWHSLQSLLQMHRTASNHLVTYCWSWIQRLLKRDIIILTYIFICTLQNNIP